MRVALIALVAACSAPAVRPVAAPAPVPVPPPEPGLSGRVLLDGVPVPYFGVSVMRHALGIHRPTEVRAADGRFRIPAKRGHWDVVVAGPGFARSMIADVQVAGPTDLGDIVVHRGHTVHGVVLDGSGAPVPDAVVTLSAYGIEGGRPELADLADGTALTKTDANGHYRIDDVAELAESRAHLQIVARATTDRRRSLPRVVPDADAVIDLELLATGRLEIVIPGAHDGFAMVRAVAAPDAELSGDPTPTGERFRDLPVGDYDVWFASGIDRTPPHVQRVAITRGALASVTLTPPRLSPVAVELHIGTLACDSISLYLGLTRGTTARMPCTSPDVQLAGVEPGTYSLCILMTAGARPQCRTLLVALTPAAQRFDLTR